MLSHVPPKNEQTVSTIKSRSKQLPKQIAIKQIPFGHVCVRCPVVVRQTHCVCLPSLCRSETDRCMVPHHCFLCHMHRMRSVFGWVSCTVLVLCITCMMHIGNVVVFMWVSHLDGFCACLPTISNASHTYTVSTKK